MAETNLSKYANSVAKSIREQGSIDGYHWTQIATLIEELSKYAKTSGESEVVTGDDVAIVCQKCAEKIHDKTLLHLFNL